MIDHRAVIVRWRPVAGWTARFFMVFILTAFSHAQGQTDLTDLSPEQLSKIEVTSVSKKEQKLSDTAAAIYVITQQDIRNSTATNIPELLQMAPGIDVARLSGTRWAIGSRGLNGYIQDTMLVLIDGRSVFDPLFSGVFWNEQGLMLEDIERIEVIRGPGATVWGANAVNGIVNIITKRSQDTQGILVSAGAGDQERSSGAARYGGKLGKSATYRIFSMYDDNGPAGTLNGEPSHDSSRMLKSGFRMDGNTSSHDSFMLEGQVYSGTSGEDSVGFSYTPPFNPSFIDQSAQQGENLLGIWTHKSLDGSTTSLQASFAHVAHPETGLDVNGDVAIASLQYERPLGARHDLVSGVEYDFKQAQTSSSGNVVWWSPSNPTSRIASAFVQDEMLFANGNVRLTGGLRLDHSNYTGFAIHPNARVLWKISRIHSVWAAYSTADLILGPDDTFLHTNLTAFPGATGIQVLRLVGNPLLKPEHLHAFEMGYRVQLAKKLSLDIATFYNRYSGLIEPETGQPFFEAGPPARLVLPMVNQSDMNGGSGGGEFSAKWTPAKALRLGAAYALFEMEMTQAPGTFGAPAQELGGDSPRHRLALTSSVDLARTLALNTSLSFTDRRTSQNIPGYTLVDSSLAWHPAVPVELKLGCKNLFNKQHIEFIDAVAGPPTMLERSIYGRTTWRF